MLFSGGRLLLYTFQEKIWGETSDLCRNISGPVHDGVRIQSAEYDFYFIYVFHDPGDPGKYEGKPMAYSPAYWNPSGVHLFGLGDSGTGFYYLVSGWLVQPEKNNPGLWNRSFIIHSF